jgi:serine/threonine protein kinase
MQLKLVDFGFATSLKSQSLSKTRLGTEKYMAPEFMYDKPYDALKVDVFAAGVILFVCYCGHPPFNQATDNDPYYRAFLKSNDKFWEFHAKQNPQKKYSQSFKELVNSMLCADPVKRASFSQIVTSSEWLNEPVNEVESLLQMHACVRQMHEYKRESLIAKKSEEQERDMRSGELTREQSGFMKLNLRIRSETGQDEQSEISHNCIRIKSKNKTELIETVLAKLLEAGGCFEKNDADKAIFSFQVQDAKQVRVDVRLYQLPDDETGIIFGRLSGDYFDFQKIKALFGELIIASCRASQI